MTLFILCILILTGKEFKIMKKVLMIVPWTEVDLGSDEMIIIEKSEKG